MIERTKGEIDMEDKEIFEISDEEIIEFIYNDLKEKGILMTRQEITWVINSEMDFYAFKGMLFSPEDDLEDEG
jgi:hypothetical protein